MRQAILLFLVVSATLILSAMACGQGFGKHRLRATSTFDEGTFPPGFSSVNAAPGSPNFPSPGSIAFFPDGRLLVACQTGEVFVIQNGVRLSTMFLDLRREVLAENDNGLFGVAVDPHYAINHFVYFAYAVDPDSNLVDNEPSTFGRIVRYASSNANPNVADGSSRQVLLGHSWSDGVSLPFGSHSIDRLCFGIDGTLLLSTGDGGHPEYADAGGHDSSAFAPGRIDTAEDIGAFRAQWIGSLNGKILRIDPATGNGLPSNPFYDGDPTHNRSKVWGYGLRNPFGFAVRPGTGSANPADGRPGNIYIGNCGWNTWEALDATGGGGGKNFGWPCYEGPLTQPQYQILTPSHSGCSTIGTLDNPSSVTPPALAYTHFTPSQSEPPGLGFTGYCLNGVAFYNGNNYPSGYKGACFISDVKGWIKVVKLNGDSVLSVEPFVENVGLPIDLAVSPVNGDIYYSFYTSDLTNQVRHLVYGIQSDLPVPEGLAGPVMGPSPLKVNFAGGSSHDPNGLALSYAWDFGDSSGSAIPNPTHIYTSSGKYFAKLRVRNTNGKSDSMMFCIAVGAYGTGYDVTKSGSLVATDMSNPDLVTIRDNFYPPSGSTQAYPQYVSQHLDNLKIDSIAYVYPTSMTFEGMIFQEGTNATDGGRFYPSVPKVQVFSGGRWMDVSNPTITPPYPLTYNGVNYETYILSFAPAAGTGIRLFGRVINYGTFAEVRAVAVNHAPVVRISASRTTGMRNLDVQFSVDSLYDADGDSVAAGWDFGDGNLSSEANPAHRYTAAGAYRAVFHASDSRGETVSDTILIAVLPNSAPHASIVLPHDSVYYNPADAVTFSGRANDAEQSDSTLQYSWQVILHHNTHTHPNWYTSSQRSFSYSPGIPDQGVIWFEGDLVVSDSGSLADTQRVYLFPGHRPRIAVTSSTDYTFSLQDSLYDINVSALDHDVLDSLSIQILALPSWLTVQRKSPHRWYASGDSALPLWFYDSLTTDWEISGTPGSSHRGDTLVALSILDRTGLSDTLRYPLHVCQTVLKFAPGWNLLSMPHRVPDVLRQAVFPSSTSKAFTYRDGYVTRDSVFFGDGYWLKFDSSQKQGMNGDVVLTDTIPVTKLWNMVGSLSAPVPLNQITSIPGGIIESNAFGYDTAGYYPTTLLQPGAGYWVKAKENGVLILHSSASGFSTGSSRGAPEGMQRLNTLIFEDQRGEKRNLFFKRDLTLEFASQFELPPVPPREVFDVRFATQSNVGAFGSDGPRSMSLPILLQSSSAVLNLSYTINDERRVHYFLTEQARGNVSRKYPLAGTGRLTIDGSGKKVYALVSEDIPGAYMLYQNYPNPYNPATTIRFDLPQSATISIVIMDLLGREVATLVDQKEYPAGYHSVEFNASSLSSGIYFYRLTSGSFSDVRKMALVK